MKKYLLISALAALTTSLVFAAAAASATAAPPIPHYRAIDLGTLGGPNSAPNDPGISISPSGAVVGSADTPALDPFPGDPGCLEDPCNVNDAFEWRNGVMTDLGALAGYSAGIFELNGAGVGAGVGTGVGAGAAARGGEAGAGAGAAWTVRAACCGLATIASGWSPGTTSTVPTRSKSGSSIEFAAGSLESSMIVTVAMA